MFKIYFTPKLDELKRVFNFFVTEYNYALVYEDDPHFMACMCLRYERDGCPTIKVVMDRSLIDIEVEHNGEFELLRTIYKFYHPKEILRCSEAYRIKKTFWKLLAKDTKLYYDFYMSIENTFDVKVYNEFAKKYPWYVWKWIEE